MGEIWNEDKQEIADKQREYEMDEKFRRGLLYRDEARRWIIKVSCSYCGKEQVECNCVRCALCKNYAEEEFMQRVKLDGESYEMVCDFCIDKGREE